MRKLHFTTFIVLALNMVSCSQDVPNKSDLFGRWQFKSHSMEEASDCVDEIVFDELTYKVYNECYGDDVNDPIVERGQWEFNSKKNSLILKNRVFISNYSIISSSKETEVEVIQLKDNMLEIGYIKEGYKMTERFIRIK